MQIGMIGLGRMGANMVRRLLSGVMPVLANIPASRMNPGASTDTPTPCGRRSSRRPSANPRSPNFVAE